VSRPLTIAAAASLTGIGSEPAARRCPVRGARLVTERVGRPAEFPPISRTRPSLATAVAPVSAVGS
jgi:hypothetical protein